MQGVDPEIVEGEEVEDCFLVKLFFVMFEHLVSPSCMS